MRRLQRGQADLAVALTTGDGEGAVRARAAVAEARRSLGELPDRPAVVGRVEGTASVVLGVVGLLVVPLAGVLAAALAAVGLARARAAGAPPSTRLWWGLALGVLALLLVAALTASTGPYVPTG
jgi:uncharacterized membrane protein